jgi:hypothetical protein
MFCSYCGAPNPDDGRFCAACGRGLAATPASVGARPRSTPASASGHNAPMGSETELGLHINSILINRYRVRRELGIGGMGRVYLSGALSGCRFGIALALCGSQGPS